MDTISNIPITVNDTIEYLVKSDVVAFYTDMMEKQATQFTILISVVSAVFVIAIGATWWWNYAGAKQQIRDEVNNLKQPLFRLYRANIKQTKKEIDSVIQDRFSECMKDFQKQVDEIDAKGTKQLEEFQFHTTREINYQQAELCRIFALYSGTNGSKLNAITWWIEALRNYALVGDEKWISVSCEGLQTNLKTFDIKDITPQLKDEYDFTSDIEIIKQYFPKTRDAERKYVIHRLEEIQDIIKA